MSRRVSLGLLVFVAWTVLAIFFAASTSLTYIAQGRPGLWTQSLAIELAQWWIWAALTPLALWASRRFPLTRTRAASAVAVHLPLAALVALLAVEAESTMRVLLFHVKAYLLVTNLARHFLIYWVLVAVMQVLDRYGRSRTQAADAESRLGQAQLALLRAQLQPHFLFNALNTIAELIHEDPDRAELVVDRLGHLLRSTLEAHDRPMVTAEEEIDLARQYLAIQEVRFGERLRISIDLPDGCRDALVPHLCLQPLIENAVRHGLAPRAGGGALAISAAADRTRLLLTIEDDGVGWVNGTPRERIGLANTRSRLHALYGDAASLTLGPGRQGGAIAQLTLPFRVRAANSRT